MNEKDFRDFRKEIVDSKKICYATLTELKTNTLSIREGYVANLLETLIKRIDKSEEILSKLLYESLTKDDLK